MKKILLLLILVPLMAISQTIPADATALENLQITNNTTSLTATKVNVQDANGVINTIPKSDLVNVVEVNDVPSLPLIGEAGKIYVVKNVNKIYRWNGTFYQELADNNNVKLTGDQTIYDTKSFNNLATKNSSIVIEANSGGGGQGAIQINNRAQNSGLRIDQSNGNSTSVGILIKNNISSNSVLADYSAPTGIGKAYEVRNLGITTFLVNNLGEVSGSKFKKSSAPVNNFLLAGGGDIAQSDLPISSITQAALDLKANDSDVVKLTGEQTIDGYKTFTSTLTATTSNNDDFAVNAFSDAGNGVIAKSNTSTALIVESVSAPAAKFKTTSGSRIVSFEYGFDDKSYIDTNGGYVKSSVPSSNILLAGGGDLAQGTAFNKNFGTTAGTVVEGGTLGSNAYSSTAYLPLTGNSTVTGTVTVTGDMVSNSVFKTLNSTLGGLQIAKPEGGVFWQIGVGLAEPNENLIFSNSLGVSNLSINQATGSATFASSVTATSYTATSLPVFENNAAASSLAVGQFYRTSTGVLMVKF